MESQQAVVAELKTDRVNDLIRLAKVESSVEVVESKVQECLGRVEGTEQTLCAVQDLAERGAKALELTIRGVPLTGRESNNDLLELVGRIGNALRVPLNEFSLLSAFAIGARKNAAKPDPVIICRFGEQGTRHVLLQRFIQKKGLNATEIGFSTSSRITLSENLTTINARVRGRATQLKRERAIHNFAVKDGLVRVKLNERSRYTHVRSVQELDNYVVTGNLLGNSRMDDQGTVAVQGSMEGVQLNGV